MGKTKDEFDLNDPGGRRLKSKASSVFQVQGRGRGGLSAQPKQTLQRLKESLRDGSEVLEVKDGIRDGPHLEFFNEVKTFPKLHQGELMAFNEWFENGRRKEVTFRRGRKEGMQMGGLNGRELWQTTFQQRWVVQSWCRSNLKRDITVKAVCMAFMEWYEDGQKRNLELQRFCPWSLSSWYENGNKRNEHSYHEGKTHGAYPIGMQWYKRYDGSYQNGEKHGLDSI